MGFATVIAVRKTHLVTMDVGIIVRTQVDLALAKRLLDTAPHLWGAQAARIVLEDRRADQ